MSMSPGVWGASSHLIRICIKAQDLLLAIIQVMIQAVLQSYGPVYTRCSTVAYLAHECLRACEKRYGHVVILLASLIYPVPISTTE